MSNQAQRVNVNLGCFGCLLEIVGVLGIIYIFAHWDMISKVVLGS
jgi:hypothetical protein